jgi:hypothetical protein
MFIIAQLIGALAALAVMRWFFSVSPALTPNMASKPAAPV